MTTELPTILWVTDPDYPARGRRYGDEDRWLVERLAGTFEITTCHPVEATARMGGQDLVVVRNSGPVANYPDEHAAFRAHALETGARVYNDLRGRGDQLGKGYLVELHRAGHAVIPTVMAADWRALPPVDEYVGKPLYGADSAGLTVLRAGDLPGDLGDDMIVQPRIDMRYEVSFVFVDGEFHYALATGSDDARWQLQRYDPSEEDLEFARGFIEWNAIEHGIQRVDACRTGRGDLLLVELEDLNPYLSLDLLDEGRRERFVAAFAAALERAARS